ncbi:response regulator [Mesorhizobium sp. ORM8.1]
MDIAESLRSGGFVVFEAANAHEAIAILESDVMIQVMFTDIDMPGSMDSLKLSAAVRDRWPPIKIVVTSGPCGVAVADLPEGSMFFGKPYDCSGGNMLARPRVALIPGSRNRPVLIEPTPCPIEGHLGDYCARRSGWTFRVTTSPSFAQS